MREAVGNAFMVNFIIVFIVAIILLLVGSISYSKSFRVRNRLIDIIERNECYDDNSNSTKCTSKAEIDKVLLEIGYKVSDTKTCKKESGKTLLTTNTNFRYCIYKVDSNRGHYYSVVAYGYFEIPLIEGYLEIPVKGDTKIFYTSE